MTWRRSLVRLIGSAFALAITAGGCSVIVSGDVPEFQCSVDAPTVCPAGLRCDMTAHRCVPGEAGAVDPTEAGDEDGPVDPGDGGPEADAPSGPQDNGAQCRVDADCKSKLCGSSTLLTTAITASTGPICTSPCCTSAECAASFVCFNGGTGGGYCVPKALAKRSPPPAGGKQGGATCITNTDCRSGLCTGTPPTCLDTCCVAGDCAAGSTTCRLLGVAAPPPSHDVWVCAPPAGAKLPGEPCDTNGECTTDNCIGFGAASSRVCRPPCSNTASCRLVPGFEDGHCLYNGAAGSDYFKFCYVGTTTTDLAAGAPCTNNGECQSDYCDAELKKCANVCAKDRDCAANEACRPAAVNTPYLRCVPRP